MSSKDAQTKTPSIMFGQTSGHPVAHSCWHIKVTVTLGKLAKYIKVACDGKVFIREGPLVLTHLLLAMKKEGVDSFIQSLIIIIHIIN